MKGIKKLLTGILAATLAFTMNVTAFAAETDQIPVGTAPVGSGEGTITVESSVEGEVYSLYKIFDFEAVTNADGTKSTTEGVYTIDSDSDWYAFVTSGAGKDYVTITTVRGKNYVKWKADTTPSTTGKDETAIAAFAKLAYEYAQSLTADAQVKADKKGAQFTEVKYGYYMVGSSVGAIVGINTATPNATIKEKNEQPTSEKKVQEDSTGNFGDKNDADIGQTVNYKSTVTIPAGGALNVVFEDKMTDSLDLVEDSIKIDGTLATTSSVVKEVKIVKGENETKSHEFSIAFNDADTSALTKETTYEITYSAVLNEKAVIFGAEGTEFSTGNDNHSRITYGNSGHTEWDWTRTYTYPIKLRKVNEKGAVLPGAVFTIARNSAKDTLLNLVMVTEGNDKNPTVYRLAKAGETGITEMVTPDSGLITINGLDADAYILTETKAPEGYNLLENPITITITSETTPAEKQGDKNKYQTENSATYTSSSLIVNEGDTGAYTGTLDIMNLTGTLLPSTGGIGTTIFYIVGGVLIVAAAAYFILRRKADAE